MTRLVTIPILAFLALLAVATPSRADYETRELDPLSEKDLSSFREEGAGGWKVDNETDMLYTLIVCPKAEDETTLLYIGRQFKQGFQVRFEAMGGSRNKGLELFVVEPQGARVKVPFKPRWLGRSDWHEIVLTVEDSKAKVQVDDETGEEVEVPKGKPLTFALRLGKRDEATLRKLQVRYLVINEEQKKPDEGFVRIFDGKSLDGWQQLPQGSTAFKVGDEQIVGATPAGTPEVHLAYADAQFEDFVLKCRVDGSARNLIVLGRMGVKDQYPPVYATISNYFPGDREWNDVRFEVQGKNVSLAVNGNKVWEQVAQNEMPLNPRFILGQNGQARIRDVQVQGKLKAYGNSWPKYAKESGVDVSGQPAAGGGAFGGRGNDQSPSADARKVLFDGTSLDDWPHGPADVWKIVDGKMLGLTLDKEVGGEILYGKLLFLEYRFEFQVQSGTAGASFIAKRAHRQDPQYEEARVKLEDAWFTEPWNAVEIWCRDGVIKVSVNGKEVYTGKVPKERGLIGFHLDKGSAIGVKDFVWTRPQ